MIYIKKKERKIKDHFPCTVYYFLQFVWILVMGKGHLSFGYSICVCVLEKGVALQTSVRTYVLETLMKNDHRVVMRITG